MIVSSAVGSAATPVEQLAFTLTAAKGSDGSQGRNYQSKISAPPRPLFRGRQCAIFVPTAAYPAACAWQAWASAAPFAFLGACLGMDVGHTNSVSCRDAAMPAFLNCVTLNRMRLGNAGLDIRLQRHGRDVTLNLLRRQGDAKVMLVK
jgi:hypothetical protein